MGNYTFTLRAKRRVKIFINYMNEKLHGLDFSMVYVGELQKNIDEFHGYSMTDAGDMKGMLQAVPIDIPKAHSLMLAVEKGRV